MTTGTISITSNEICPMILDLVKQASLDGFDADDNNKALQRAVAHIAFGLVMAEEAGAEDPLEFVNAANVMAKTFTAWVNKKLAETDEQENDQ